MCGSKCVFSICFYVWVKMCGRTFEGNLVCVNLPAVEARRIVKEKSNFSPPSFFFLPPSHYFCLTLKSCHFPPSPSLHFFMSVVFTRLYIYPLYYVLTFHFNYTSHPLISPFPILFSTTALLLLFSSCLDVFEMNLCVCALLVNSALKAVNSFEDRFCLKRHFCAHPKLQNKSFLYNPLVVPFCDAQIDNCIPDYTDTKETHFQFT